MTTAINLSGIPKGPHDLEDYVAALFHASRCFVETNITERDPADILELDAVATSYEHGMPLEILAEAKSGDWGYPDMFKVIGWMRYLNIGRSAFFVAKEIKGKEPASVRKRFEPLGMSFVHLGDCSEVEKLFKESCLPEICDTLLVPVWRFSHWAERNLISQLRRIHGDDLTKRAPLVALDHHRLLNDAIFFMEDPSDRLFELYTAFMKHPKLACGAAREMDGGEFDPSIYDPTNERLREAMQAGKHPLIQACFYLEHRARLSILKTAIDYECKLTASKLPPPSLVTYSALPPTFRNGVDILKCDAYFKRYALFWQVFLWGFGGFYLDDRKEQEFKWLADQTGIPVEEIPNALKVFDILFPPAKGSWLTKNGPRSQCMIAKLVPTPFRGLGAAHRRWRYGYKEYSEFGYTDYTGKDLREWNNALVELLK